LPQFQISSFLFQLYEQNQQNGEQKASEKARQAGELPASLNAGRVDGS